MKENVVAAKMEMAVIQNHRVTETDNGMDHLKRLTLLTWWQYIQEGRCVNTTVFKMDRIKYQFLSLVFDGLDIINSIYGYYSPYWMDGV